MKQTLLFLFGIPLLAAPKLAILPSNVSLTKSVEVQHLLAESVDGVYQQDLTRKVQWSSSNPQIASVDQEGLVKPVGNGEATISAKADGLDASVTVHVSNATTPYTYSFRNDVIPVMSKVGCNQGACHGALAGKGSGTLHDFQMQVDTEPAGRVTSEQLGDYPAVVNGLQITVKNAYDHVGSVYDAFLQSYDSFAKSLAKVGQNYGDTEDANKNNAGNGHPKAV